MVYNCPFCDLDHEILTYLLIHARQQHDVDGETLWLLMYEDPPTCGCGCGEETTFINIEQGYNRFIRGHNTKLKDKKEIVYSGQYKCPEEGCEVRYDNLISLNHHYCRGHKKTSKGLYIKLFCNNIAPICACGICEEEPYFKSITKGFKNYIHGHNSKPPIKFNEEIEKYCPKCKKVLPLENFRERNNERKYQSYCIECYDIYTEENMDRILENRKRRRNNPEWKAERNRKARERLASDINRRLKLNLRRYLHSRIKRNIVEAKKCRRTMDLVGCSIEFLKEHLENKFQDGMTWDNYGQRGWHIDHIVPCSEFDLSNPMQQMRCFHYTNLQPLWWYDNIKKGNKVNQETIDSIFAEQDLIWEEE